MTEVGTKVKRRSVRTLLGWMTRIDYVVRVFFELQIYCRVLDAVLTVMYNICRGKFIRHSCTLNAIWPSLSVS